jgi:hypothetical protein
MNTLKKISCLFSTAFIFWIGNASPTQATHFADEDYADLVKKIVIKNHLAEQESQISSINIKYNMASVADHLANLSGVNEEVHDRKVSFSVNFADLQRQIRIYNCNLTVKIPAPNDFTGTKLTSCEIQTIDYNTYTY